MVDELNPSQRITEALFRNEPLRGLELFCSSMVIVASIGELSAIEAMKVEFFSQTNFLSACIRSVCATRDMD